MPVELTFTSKDITYTLTTNESRITRIMNSDKDTATYMGWWDTFKDFFRTEKKQDALNALYDVIHGTSGVDKLQAFTKLQSYAGTAHQSLFKVESDSNRTNLQFYIDQSLITSAQFNSCMPDNLMRLIDPTKSVRATLAFRDFSTSNDGGDKLLAFKKLQQCATPAGATALQFTWEKSEETTQDILSFKLAQEELGTCLLHQALYLTASVEQLEMTPEEKVLAISTLSIAYDAMLDALQDTNDGNRVATLRDSITNKTRALVQQHYRPNEDIGLKPAEPKLDLINAEQKKTLHPINHGTFNWSGQFHQVGYKTNNDKVTFTLVHPLITYIRKTMLPPDMVSMTLDQTSAVNTGNMQLINEGLITYSKNKETIDNVLTIIYQTHGNTLAISNPNDTGCRNRLG